MRNIIDKLIGLFKSSKKDKFLSSIYEYIGDKKFQALIIADRDPKEYLDVVSILMEVSVASALAELAQKLDMIPLHLIPNGYEIESTTDLLEFGIAPIKKEGILLGVASCFPDWIKSHAPKYSGLPIFLMPWSVMSALQSENSTIQYQDQLLKAILSVNGVTVSFSSGSKEYLVTTADEKKAKGFIHPNVSEILFKEAKSKVDSGQNYIISNKVTFEIIIDGLTIEYKKSSPKLSLVTSENTQEEEPNLLVSDKKRKKVSEPYVMLCDDNKSFIHIVSKYLNTSGIKTKSFIDAQEAIEFIQSTRKPPAVLVCDLHMPGKNGFDVVRELKARELGVHVSVITLTSDQDIEAEIALIELGVDVFIRKNEDPRVLAAHIKRLLQKHPGAALKGAKSKAA